MDDLLKKLDRNITNVDTDLTYLRFWLQQNNLLTEERYVCWNASKQPISPKTNNFATLTDTSTYASFDYCLSYFNSHKESIKGIGIVLGIDSNNRNIVAININNATDNLNKVKDILNTVEGYTEISASKNGVHLITFANDIDIKIKERNGVSFLQAGEFIALTGVRYSNVPLVEQVNDQSEEITTVYNKYVCGKLIDINSSKSQEQLSTPLYALSNKKLSKKAQEVFDLIKSNSTDESFSKLYAGEWQGTYRTKEEADEELCSILAFWSQKNKAIMNEIYMSSALMSPEWANKNGLNYGNTILQSALDTCTIVYQPNGFDMVSSLTPALSTDQVQDQQEGAGQVVENGKVQDYDLNDTGNARRFSALYHSTCKFNIDDNTFMVYRDNRWQEDTKANIFAYRLVDKYVDYLKLDMMNEPNEDIKKKKRENVNKLYSHKSKEYLLEELKHQPDMATYNNIYDSYDDYINTPNEIIDLTTGNLMHFDKKLNQKNVAGTFYSKNDPKLWLSFLNETFGNNAMWIRKFIAYCLSGSIGEEIFVCLYGAGNNGKSVFTRTLSAVMGEYALPMVPIDMFTNRGYSHGDQMIGEMLNKRLVISSEPNKSAELNSGYIKNLTGGSYINARKLYGNPYVAMPHFKLIFETNPKPSVVDDTDGFYRRARFVHCTHIVPAEKVDIHLYDKLLKELPEILGLAVRDYQLYLKEGLKMTVPMEEDLNDYKCTNSYLEYFLQNECEIDPKARTKAIDLYERQRMFALEEGLTAYGKKEFYASLQIKYDKRRGASGDIFVGIKLKTTGYFKQTATATANTIDDDLPF